jgi:toxin ParE1/3/4
MIIAWSKQALDDLAALHDFIAQDNPSAAQRTAARVVDTVEQLLPEHPHIGRAGRVPGTRELAIAGTPYVVPYRIRQGVLQMLRVYHGARKWPDHFQNGQ